MFHLDPPPVSISVPSTTQIVETRPVATVPPTVLAVQPTPVEQSQKTSRFKAYKAKIFGDANDKNGKFMFNMQGILYSRYR